MIRAPFRTLFPARFGSGRHQSGVSLLLALIFVTFFGGVLITLARFNAYEIRIAEARVVGWEIVEIAKAARLYVRDRYAADETLPTTAATPSRITLDTLRTAGYLPRDFGRNAAGNDLSALNQNIYVIMANWSGSGTLGGPVNEVTTVPTAFVYFDHNGKTAPDLMVDAVETARQMGASINGVLFDRDGNNRTADCRGEGPAVAVWDTGCLTNSEFQQLAGAIGIPTDFLGGALLIPAWKSVQPDLRAVLRFPQPENPGFATMLTDLQMGTPTGNCSVQANQVSITTLDSSGNVVDEPTWICDVVDDDAANDRRYNIDHVGNIQAQRMITEPQTQDFGGESADIGTAQDDSMRISGNLTLNNDMRIYNVRPLPAGVTHRMDVPNGTLAVERNTYLYSTDTGGGPPSTYAGIATIGTATARNLVSDQLDTPNFNSTSSGLTVDGGGTPVAPQMSVTTLTDLTGNLSVTGDPEAELIAEDIEASGATVRATDNTGEVQVTQVLSLPSAGTMTVNGYNHPTQYAAIVGEITNSDTVHVTGQNNGGLGPDLRFLSGQGSITTNSTADYAGNPTPTVSTARCLESANLAGGCPERQYYPPNITP